MHFKYLLSLKKVSNGTERKLGQEKISMKMILKGGVCGCFMLDVR
jgi:hypothetical protein